MIRENLIETAIHGVVVREINNEQFDVLQNGHHIGTLMDTGCGTYVARAFQSGPLFGGNKRSVDSYEEGLQFIVEQGS